MTTHRLSFFSRWCSALLLILVTLSVQARELSDVSVGDQAARLTLSDGVRVSLRFLPFNSVEVVYHEAGTDNLPGLALAPALTSQRPALKQTDDGYRMQVDAVGVHIQRAPFRLSFAYRGDVKTAEQTKGFFSTATLRGFRFALNEDEMLYGGGQRVVGMDRRGHRMPLYNRAHYGYTTESSQMYYSLPGVLSSSNYAILFDNTAKGTLDIGASEPSVLQFSAVAGRRAYIVTMGDSTPEVSRNVVSVTGRQPLPPRWTLGNFASRFGYRSEAQTRDVVSRFEQAEIPLDAVVLDLYWFGKDVKGHMGNLHWDRTSFPTPQAMIDDFQRKDIHTVLITEPFILTSSSTFKQASAADALAKGVSGAPRTFDFFFGNTGLVDVFSEEGRAWFSAQYRRLLEQGVAGFWGDLGEPEVHPEDTLHTWQGRQVTADEIHNAYGHQWANMVYNTLLEAQPERRPFLLMRSGFLGSQRYAMVPWTGDVSRSWGGLKPQVELALQMSVFGLAYTHSDLGGFAGGEKFDPELYLRWLQLGEFQPVFRPHAQEDIAPEPVFHGEKVKSIARDILHRRYQMLPYNYSLMVENSLTGMPLMRPLSFYHPQKTWFAHADSFYWGPSVLVAPVTEPDVDEWQVALPPGVWYQRGYDQRHEGGKTLSVATNISSIPVFIKNGAIIPQIAPVNNTAQADYSTLDVHVWAGRGVQANSFTYYEDDGLSRSDDEAAARYRAHFTLQQQNKQIVLTASGSGRYPGMPTSRTLVWHVHGLDAAPTSSPQSAVWHEDSKILTLRQPFNNKVNVTLTRQ